MNKFLEFATKHAKTSRAILILLLLAISATLVFKPRLILAILRYGVAGLNVVLAISLIVSAIRRGV